MSRNVWEHEIIWAQRTLEDGVDGHEEGANGHDDHGGGETEEFADDMAV